MLEFAVLGLLKEAPMHGYELRKRLNTGLGMFRAFSYGSLYPTLRRMREAGWIGEQAPDQSLSGPKARASRRGKIVYEITAEGKEHFHELLGDVSADAYEDEGFGVHFAFFSQTPAGVRMRILEGRRRRVEERREGLRSALSRTRERLDTYTLELQRHGLDSVDREVRWLNELIASEQAGAPPTVTQPPL